MNALSVHIETELTRPVSSSFYLPYPESQGKLILKERYFFKEQRQSMSKKITETIGRKNSCHMPRIGHISLSRWKANSIKK